jgi:hypothetical protein
MTAPTDRVRSNTVRPFRAVRHSGACGERVRSPHARCQAALEPYLPAERWVDRWGLAFIRCHGCGQSEVAG